MTIYKNLPKIVERNSPLLFVLFNNVQRTHFFYFKSNIAIQGTRPPLMGIGKCHSKMEDANFSII